MEGNARYMWTAVPIQAVSSGAPQIGEPTPLFTFTSMISRATNNVFVYSPAADGQRLLVNSRANLSSGTLNVMTNWEKAATQSGAK